MHGAFGTEVTKTASADILGGQAVQINSNGTVAPATASTQKIIGVALYDIPAGTEGAIRVAGVARCANGDGATAITAGAAVTAGTLGGIVAHSSGTALGIALEPIAGGATGLVALGVFTA
jgi:predicted RecA/RadA family phage recombinase